VPRSIPIILRICYSSLFIFYTRKNNNNYLCNVNINNIKKLTLLI
jgi:hypothetical protein